MSDKPYAAIPFEAVKVSLRQTKDGVVVSFVVHPDDVQGFLLTDPVGSRYQLVAVNLDLTPAMDGAREGRERAKEERPPVNGRVDINPVEKARQNVVASAGILCRDKRFHDWVRIRSRINDTVGQVQAIEWMLDQLGIKSRAALKEDPIARAAFFNLRKEFEAWKLVTPPF